MTQRDRWVREIREATRQMLWGSLAAVYRRCGRPTCHCATGTKHGPVWYLARHAEGRTRMIYVPEEVRARVEQGVVAYRRYRALGQQLAEANARALGLERRRRRR